MRNTFPILVIGLILNCYAMAEPTSAIEIVTESERRDDGYGGLSVDLEMILHDKKGNRAARYLSIKQMEVDADGDRTMLRMLEPLSIRGTTLLSHAHPDKPDDQWVYLPAIKRVKKISSRNKSGPFLGSTFSFEDLVAYSVEKYQYRLRGTDQFFDAPHWIVEKLPIDQSSGYSKQLVWYNKERYTISRVDFFDKQGNELKTLTLTDFRQYQDKFWRAHHMMMENHQTGKSTELVWSEFTFSGQFSEERDFSVNALRRSRS